MTVAGPRPLRWCLAGAAAALLAAPLAAAAPETAKAEYDTLQQWRFAGPFPLPAEGCSWRRDVASWELDSGRYWLQEPVGGEVTGLVFEGRGRFRMEIPDPHELAQLRRFAGDEEMRLFETTFDLLVLRTSDPAPLVPLAQPGADAHRPHRKARERHERWLRVQRVDADSRVVAARLNRGGSYLRVDLRSSEHGWLTFDYDSRRHEEIRLLRYNHSHSFLERWVGLDREADRRGSGRPGPVPEPAWDLDHVAVTARLLRLGKDPGTSPTLRVTRAGEFTAALDLRVAGDGQRALQLYLLPRAEVLSVRDGEGRPLPFLRDPIGDRFRTLDDREHDHSLVVLLRRPAAAGERLRLTVEYELEVGNFVPGRLWYPGAEAGELGLSDRHTAELRIEVHDEYDVRAMGERVEERIVDGIRTSRWRVERPVKMATFAFARKVVEETIERANRGEVAVFSPPLGRDTPARLRRLGEEIAAALDYYEELLDDRSGDGRLYATMIQAAHGQAYEGFLHLAEESAFRERSGPSELFLAHEAAHQWWGHRIGWATYRDQWLSEGLANYSALLYLEARHPKGEQLFRDAIEAYTHELLGSIRSRMSPFSIPGLALMNRKAAARIGPIGHGYRARTGEAPTAYLTQSYRKATLVLHTLRSLLRLRPKGESLFVGVLRDFARVHRDGQPSTDDFAAAVARRAPGEWERFFEQWVFSAEIPEWSWRADISPAAEGGGFEVTLEVRQTGVSDDFRTAAPVRTEFADGEPEERLIEIAGPQTVARWRVASEPRRVVLNPDFAVLARMSRR